MSVTRTCSPGNGAVGLRASEGEYLEYRIPSADGDTQYVLSDGEGGSLLDNRSCPPPCAFRWPTEGARPEPGEARHTLAMQFFGDHTLTYEVERCSEAGAVLEQVKRCSFRNSGGADEFFEALRIFVS